MIKRTSLLAAAMLLAASAGSGTVHAEDVRIGVVAGLTGAYAFAGVPARDGMAIAVAELNAAHFLGDHRIELAIQDSGSEKGQAVTLINAFGADARTLLVLGPNSSGEGVAMGAVANGVRPSGWTDWAI